MKRALAVWVVPLLACLPCLGGEPPMVRVYKAAAPAVDGKLDDACWAGATTVCPFLAPVTAMVAAHDTALLFSYDDSRLYAAFKCSCGDSELLRVADGDLSLNDRVELLIRWPGAKEQSIVVDAGGRVKRSGGSGDVAVAAVRGRGHYAVEIALPRPPAARSFHFLAQRHDEIIGEASRWASRDEMAQAELDPRAGPVAKIHKVPRYPSSRHPLELSVSNPREGYLAVRCRVAVSPYSISPPHIVRLKGKQSATVLLSYEVKDVARRGFSIVVDDPSGRTTYLRAPTIPPPIGKAPRKREIPVTPYPQSVVIPEEGRPFVVTGRCRIALGRGTGELEREAAKRIASTIKGLCGLELRIERRRYSLAGPAILIATRRTSALAQRAADQLGVGFPKTCPGQSYAVAVTPKLIAVVAQEDLGTVYGVETLLQVLRAAPSAGGTLEVPAMRIHDWPVFMFRGCLWRGARLDHPAIYPALRSLKVNLLSATPGADAKLARANGIHLAKLTVPPGPGGGAERKRPFLKMEPWPSLPRVLRRSLRLPVAVEGDGAQTRQPLPRPKKPKRTPTEVRQTVLRREDAVPVAATWVRADPHALLQAARLAAEGETMVGLCGELRDDPLLPPSWARVAAAAEYGWSPKHPAPDRYLAAFYEHFYGSAQAGQARRLLERAVASLPRDPSLAALLEPARPAPRPPRPDIAALVQAAKAKAATAKRNQELARLLASSGNRVLAAAANVATALRLRKLHAEAAELHRKGQHADAAVRLTDMGVALGTGADQALKLLGRGASESADVRLYRSAAAAVARLIRQYAETRKLPERERFWRVLRGGTP